MGQDVESKMKEIVDKDLCVYIGEVNADDKPHGNGSISCPDGSKYWGKWADGRWHGKGRYHWDNGTYDGGFWHGEAHGVGTRYMVNNEEHCYTVSRFRSNKRHGIGRHVCIKNDLFEGVDDLVNAF